MTPATRWIGGIVLLLGVNVVAGVVLIAAAGGDTARRVVPDYYQRAVAWDQTMAANETSARLGWQITATPAGRALEVTVRDHVGAPVASAVVVVHLVPRGHADEPSEITLTATAAGTYRGLVPGLRLGLHDATITVTRGAEHWRGDRLIELAAGPRP